MGDNGRARETTRRAVLQATSGSLALAQFSSYVSADATGPTVFVGANDGTLYAVNAETGRQVWEFTDPSLPIQSSPTVVDETVYVASRHTLYAVAAETGEQVWSCDTIYGSIYSSPTVVDGTLYIGASDTQLYAIETETGEVDWRFNGPNGAVRSSPTVVGSRVYVGDDGGALYAVNTETGEQEWVFSSPTARVRSSPAVVDGTVFIGTRNGSLYAVDTTTGEREWAFTQPLRELLSSPTVADGTVFIGSNSGRLYSVDAATGQQNWVFTEPDADVRSSPTVVDGTVFVGSQDSTLYAINASTGEQEWAYTHPNRSVRSSPTVLNETVYVGSTDGEFHAVDLETGLRKWIFSRPEQSVLSSPTGIDLSTNTSVGSRVRLGTLGHTDTLDDRVIVRTRPSITVTIVDITEPTAGNDLEIELLVENTGNQRGVQVIEAVVDGLGSTSTTVSLEAQESTRGTFSIPTTEDDSGEYNVSVTSNNDTAIESATVSPRSPVPTDTPDTQDSTPEDSELTERTPDTTNSESALSTGTILGIGLTGLASLLGVYAYLSSTGPGQQASVADNSGESGPESSGGSFSGGLLRSGDPSRKQALVYLFLCLLVVSLVLFNITFAATNTVLQEEFVQDRFEQEGAYSELTTELRSDLARNISSQAGGQDPATQLAAAAITEQYTRTQIDRNVAETVAYLEGERSSMHFRFEYTPVKKTISETVGEDRGQDINQSLPRVVSFDEAIDRGGLSTARPLTSRASLLNVLLPLVMCGCVGGLFSVTRSAEDTARYTGLGFLLAAAITIPASLVFQQLLELLFFVPTQDVPVDPSAVVDGIILALNEMLSTLIRQSIPLIGGGITFLAAPTVVRNHTADPDSTASSSDETTKSQSSPSSHSADSGTVTSSQDTDPNSSGTGPSPASTLDTRLENIETRLDDVSLLVEASKLDRAEMVCLEIEEELDEITPEEIEDSGISADIEPLRRRLDNVRTEIQTVRDAQATIAELEEQVATAETLVEKEEFDNAGAMFETISADLNKIAGEIAEIEVETVQTAFDSVQNRCEDGQTTATESLESSVLSELVDAETHLKKISETVETETEAKLHAHIDSAREIVQTVEEGYDRLTPACKNRIEEVNDDISRHETIITAAVGIREDIAVMESKIADAISLREQKEYEDAIETLTTVQTRLEQLREDAHEREFETLGEDIENQLERCVSERTSIEKRIRPGPPANIVGTQITTVTYEDIERNEPIGKGGNADVYLTETHDGVEIAIKEPRLSGTLHSDTVERFMAEAKTWSQLDSHDHIVDIVDYDADPLPWIAMEYMDAGDLNERRDSMDIRESLWAATQITDAVLHAHRLGVVHLDLKPANILFRTTSDNNWAVPKVADWGLAKMLLDHSKSIEGLTPRYAAPEQIEKSFGSTGHETDVYQLGAVFYELFTGEPVYTGEPFQIIRKVVDDEPRPPTQVMPELPDSVDDILLKALTKQKEHRYEDLVYLRDSLDEVYTAL